MSEHEEGQEQTEQTEKTVETENIEGAGSNEEEAEEDKEATEQNNEQESKEKQATSEEDEKENDIQSSATVNGARAKIEKETSEAEQGLDDEWKAKMEEAVLKLRSTLKEKLVKLGIKPEGKRKSIWRFFIVILKEMPLSAPSLRRHTLCSSSNLSSVGQRSCTCS